MPYSSTPKISDMYLFALHSLFIAEFSFSEWTHSSYLYLF